MTDPTSTPPEPTPYTAPAATPYAPPAATPYAPPAANPYQNPAATPYTAGAATGPRTNTLAIIALIAAFVVPLAGIIVGHIALGQIKRTGEAGHGLALWGTILGYVFTALYVLLIGISILIPIFLATSSYNSY